MFIRSESFARVLVSAIASLAFASVMISAAAPIIPIV